MAFAFDSNSLERFLALHGLEGVVLPHLRQYEHPRRHRTTHPKALGIPAAKRLFLRRRHSFFIRAGLQAGFGWNHCNRRKR